MVPFQFKLVNSFFLSEPLMLSLQVFFELKFYLWSILDIFFCSLKCIFKRNLSSAKTYQDSFYPKSNSIDAISSARRLKWQFFQKVMTWNVAWSIFYVFYRPFSRLLGLFSIEGSSSHLKWTKMPLINISKFL